MACLSRARVKSTGGRNNLWFGFLVDQKLGDIIFRSGDGYVIDQGARFTNENEVRKPLEGDLIFFEEVVTEDGKRKAVKWGFPILGDVV